MFLRNSDDYNGEEECGGVDDEEDDDDCDMSFFMNWSNLLNKLSKV